jgi:hypothetical protein
VSLSLARQPDPRPPRWSKQLLTIPSSPWNTRGDVGPPRGSAGPRGASIVLSVNSAADATDALRDSPPALETGTIWADLNTATPGLKERLAALGGQRARVVDVALMPRCPVAA